jgi:hypothetical protein
MNRKLRAEDQRRHQARDRSAWLALSLWGVGGYLLCLCWRAAGALPLPWSNLALIGIYLVAFFFAFAFWPILVEVARTFRAPAERPGTPLDPRQDQVTRYHGPPAGQEAQDGGNAIQPERSSIGSSREAAGGASSSAAGR